MSDVRTTAIGGLITRRVAGQARSDDPVVLKRRLRRQARAKQGMALLLILPAFLFLIVNFIVPVGIILFKSVDDREVSAVLHRTADEIADWDGEGLPEEAVFRALLDDIREANENRTLFNAGKRLNTAKAGFQGMLIRASQSPPPPDGTAIKETLISRDARWADPGYWNALQRMSSPVTPLYLLAAFDLALDDTGDVVAMPEHMRAFNTVWLRTVWMAAVITGICVILGYPLAYLMANVSARTSNILMLMVLLPFWTAVLVRTTAWVVLLQNEGLLNDIGLALGLWEERVQLIRNRFGVYVTMAHVLLPFMVLPLFAIMKRIPPQYMRAAASLGANPVRSFLRVYVPQTLHGVGAGASFVFILAIGFYITPALVGGQRDQMISYFIAFYAGETLNWGAAAALSAILLAFTLLLYFLLNLLFGINKLKMR